MNLIRTLFATSGRLPERAKIRQQSSEDQWWLDERRRRQKEALK